MAVKIKDPSLADGQSRYQKLLSQARQVRQDRDAAGVNDAYISSFLTDSDKFLTDSQSQLNSMNWSSATDRSRANRREEQLSDLGYRAGVIGKYLEANKGTMDEKTYGTLSRTLKNYSDKFDAAKNAFAANSKYYSQFGSQRDYDRYINYSGKTADELTALLEKQTDSTERAWLSSYIQQLRDQETAAETRKNLEYLDELDKEFDQQWYDYNNVVNRGGIAGATPMQNERAQIMFENTMQARKDTLAKVTEKDRYEWAGIKLTENALKDKDFAAYAKKGAAVENPNMADVLKSGGLFGSSQKPVNKVMYTLQNWDAYEKLKFSNNNPVLGTVDASAYGLYDLAPHMTADEVNIYNYYLAKDMEDGTSKADEYLRFMEETLNTRKGAAHAGELQGKTALELGYAAVAGLDQFVQGVKNVGSMFSWDPQSNYVPTSSAQVAGSIIREDLKDDTIPMWYNFKTGKWESTIAGNSLGQMAYDSIQTSANMVPSILLSTAVGIVNPAAGAAVGGALLGASAAGNAYQQKIQAGYTQSQARSYGALVGISEAVLETALGAVGGAAGKGLKGVLGKVSQTGIQKIDDVLARVAKTAGGKIATNALGEGAEEAIQSILEPAFAHVVAGEEFTVDMEETLYSALLGAVMGAGFGAASPNTYQGNIPGISSNEKTQLKTVLDERVKSREESLGRELTAAEKLDIEIAVRNEIITQRGDEAAAPVQGTAPSGAAPSAQQQAVSQPRQDATATVPGQQNVSAPAQKPDGLGIVQELLEAAKPDPIFDALKSYRDSGIVSNKKAEAILANPEALQQLTQQTGISIEGTKSQQRAAVKEAVAKIDEPPVDNTAAATYDNTINQGGIYNGQRLQQNDGAGSLGNSAEGMAGVQPANRAEFEGRKQSGGVAVGSGVLRVSQELQSAQASRGTPTYPIYDTTAKPDSYAAALEAGRSSDVKNGWCVTPKTAQDLQSENVRTVMNADGTVGAGIAPNGDIVAVFKNKNGGPAKALHTLMPAVIEQGGDRLDCYGEGLVGVYAQYGFIPVARVEFNPEYANDGWTPDKGTPYIYFMAHNGDSAAVVAEKIGAYPEITKQQLDSLPTFGKEAYDEAMAYRDNYMDRKKASAPTESVGAAPAGTDEAFAQMQAEYGKQKAGENPVRPDDVPKSTDGNDRVSHTAVNVKGAKVTPDEFVPLLDRDVTVGGMSYIPITNSQTVQKAMDEISEMGWEDSFSSFHKAVESGMTGADLVAKGSLLLNNAATAGNKDLWLDILHDFQRLGTNTAQGLQAFRILKTLAPSDKLYMVEKTIDQLISETGVKVKLDEDVLNAYRNAETAEEQDALLDEIIHEIADQLPTSFIEKWDALRYVNMLGNLRTQVRNVAGNVGMAAASFAKDKIATTIELLANKASGGKVGRTKSFTVSREQLAAANAYFNEVKSAVLGETKYDLRGSATSASDIMRQAQQKKRIFGKNDPQNALSKYTINLAMSGLEKYRKATSWAMEKGDLMFSKSAFARAMAGYLKAKGETSTDYSKIDQNLLNEATLFAIKEAQERTFRDNNAFSDLVSRIGRGKKVKWPLKAVAEGILPFRKTPANVLVRATEYSPIGFINATIKTIKADTAKSDITWNDAINSWAKFLTGTGAFMLGMLFHNMGWLTGGMDEDDPEDRYSMMNGQQEYSIKIGNHSITIDWLSPIAIPMLMGAELNKLRQDGDISVKDLESALSSITEPLVQMSMLEGVNDALENVRFSDSSLAQIFINAGLNYLTQGLTNTALGQIERSLEDSRITTYVDEDSLIPNWLQRTIGKASAKTPGLDYNQIPYINAWGEEEENPPVWAGLAENMASPGYIAEGKEDDVSRELVRLHNATGKNVFPQEAEKKLTVNNKDYALSANEYVKLAKTQGQKARKLVESIIADSAYKDLSEDKKQKVINAAYTLARETGRAAAVSEYEEDIPKYISERPSGMSETEAIIRHFAYGSSEKYASLPVETATFVDELLASLTPPSGKKEPTTSQKITAITGADNELTERQQAVVLKETLSDPAYEKYLAILKKGYNNDEYAISYEIYTREKAIGGESTKDRTIEMFQKRFNLSESAATALYEIYNPK